MNARFVACAAAALVCAAAADAGARTPVQSPSRAILAVAAVPAQSPVPAATPAPSPTPVNLPPLPPTTKVDPYTRAAIDLLTGAVNRAIGNLRNTTSGTVSYFKRFDLQVQTGPSAYREVHLHQGTIIDPRGTTLAVGQHVDVGGTAQSDGSLNANVITVH